MNDEKTLSTLKQIYPDVSEESLRKSIEWSRLEQADWECRERHKDIYFSGWDWAAK